jgi:transcriptional regulator with XRE-family HTH domain
MKTIPCELGAAIRAARMEKSLSQEQLAELVGITPTHMKHIESEHRKPSVEVLFAIAAEFDLSLDDVLFPPKDNRNIREIALLLHSLSL